MIRAVLKNGVLQPLSPLPTDWQDGREVLLSVVDDGRLPTADEIDAIEREITAADTESDPQDDERMRAALAASRDQKPELPRRRTG
jgi:hypothetical protein